jgi:hypothetical protein
MECLYVKPDAYIVGQSRRHGKAAQASPESGIIPSSMTPTAASGR